MSAITNAVNSVKTSKKTTKSTTTNTSWHKILLWFLGSLALIALADPAPKVAIWLTVIIIMLVLLKNWPTYSAYLGMSKG